MKKRIISLISAFVFILSLTSCSGPEKIPPEVDPNASFKEHWCGTISDIFTEGGGADISNVIKLDIKDRDSMYFTVVENTEFLKYNIETGETEKIFFDDLYIGASAQIDCESFNDSEYHPIYTVTINEPTQDNIAEIGNITVSYANWTDCDEFFSSSLNYEKVLISGVKRVPIYKFDTLSDLDRFKSDFCEILTMDSGYNEVPSFNEVTAEYDTAFFDDNTLLLVYVDASSGSYRFDVGSVVYDDNSLCVHIERLNKPESVTDDMAGWFITVAIPKDTLETCVEFDAVLK